MHVQHNMLIRMMLRGRYKKKKKAATAARQQNIVSIDGYVCTTPLSPPKVLAENSMNAYSRSHAYAKAPCPMPVIVAMASSTPQNIMGTIAMEANMLAGRKYNGNVWKYAIAGMAVAAMAAMGTMTMRRAFLTHVRRIR